MSSAVGNTLQSSLFPSGARPPMLISTDILETALAGILQTLQRQSIDIAELRSQLADSIPRNDVIAAQNSLHDRIALLEQRVKELESTTTVVIPGDA